MSGSRIIANQSHLARGLRSNSIQVKLYVRNEPHYSGMSTCELADKHAEGYTFVMIGYTGRPVVIEVPPRPFLRQFFADTKAELSAAIAKKASIAMLRDGNLYGVVDEIKEYVYSMFMAWAELGMILPRNAEYTINKKGSDKALIDHGDLLASIDTEGHVVTTQ